MAQSNTSGESFLVALEKTIDGDGEVKSRVRRGFLSLRDVL